MLPKKMKSVIGLGSLVSVFLIVLLVNENSSKQNDIHSLELSSHRGIASASLSSKTVSESIWKRRLASQISEFSDLPSAKLARQPNALETLMFGELKGYYLLKLEGNKVGGMLLSTQNVSEDIPEYFGSEHSFLKKNRDLWIVSFDEIALKERDSSKSIFSLFDSKKNEIGLAEFAWDPSGHMTAFKLVRK